MSGARHSVVTRGAGDVVFEKAVGAPSGRAPLEAENLRRARGLRVPELIELISDGDTDILRVRWSGSHTLETVGATSVRTAATLMAEVADIVDALHGRGLSHGRLTPDHVLIDADGDPVLTGLAEARPLTVGSARADVEQLGALLTDLVAPLGDGDPFAPRWPQAASDDGRRGAVLTLADAAASPATHMTAGDLRDGLRALIAPEARERSGRRVPRRRRWAAIALGAILAVGMAARTGGSGASATHLASGPASTVIPLITAPSTEPVSRPPSPSAAPSAPPTISAPQSTTRRPSSPPEVRPTPRACPGAGGSHLDVDGDGCPDDVRVVDNLVTVGGDTRAFGDDGDVAAIGDWDCDGRASVAVLRPTSGEIFVFPPWGARTDVITVAPVTRLPGATDLVGRLADGGHCHDLLAVFADRRSPPQIVELDP